MVMPRSTRGTGARSFVPWAYATFIKRNSVFFAAICVSALMGEAIWSWGADAIWDDINRGKQWKDIKEAIEKKSK